MKVSIILSLFCLSLSGFATEAKPSPTDKKLFYEKAEGHIVRKDVSSPCLDFSEAKKQALVRSTLNMAKLKCFRAGFTYCEGEAKTKFSETNLKSCLSTVDYTINAEILGKNYDEKLALKKITEILAEINKAAKEGTGSAGPACETKIPDTKALKEACQKFYIKNPAMLEICLSSNVKKVEVLKTCAELSKGDGGMLLLCLDSGIEKIDIIKTCSEVSGRDTGMFNICLDPDKKIEDIKACAKFAGKDIHKFTSCMATDLESSSSDKLLGGDVGDKSGK